MTTPSRPERQADLQIPDPRRGERDLTEKDDPYELPFPDDRWPPGRPEFVIVVDQLRDWPSTRSPSLAELLETRSARTHEPDLEAEP
jgi:hypothetical protein